MGVGAFLRSAATCLERRTLLPKGSPHPRALLTISTCNLLRRFFSNFPKARIRSSRDAWANGSRLKSATSVTEGNTLLKSAALIKLVGVGRHAYAAPVTRLGSSI